MEIFNVFYLLPLVLISSCTLNESFSPPSDYLLRSTYTKQQNGR